MPRIPRLSVCLLASAALLCAGCELPHGPLRWDPVHLDRLDVLPHGKLRAPGPFCRTDDCDDRNSRECTDEHQQQQQPGDPQAYEGHARGRGYGQGPGEPPRGPRLTQHHHAVPLAGPGVDAPWPKFHPVPTRPVFESRCMPPPEMALPQQPQELPSQELPPQPQFLPQF